MIRYHRIEPDARRSSYTEFNDVDFSMDYMGRSLLNNTVRLSGKLTVQKAGARVGDADDLYIDPEIGVASFFNNMFCKINDQVIENNNNYPRWVKMKNQGTKSVGQLVGTGSEFCEMRCSDIGPVRAILQGYSNADPTFDFSHKLEIPFNNMSDSLDYRGTLGVSFRLESVIRAFFGAANTGDVTYSISDLCLEFQTIEMMADKPNQVTMTVVHDQRGLIDSDNFNIKSKPSAVIKSMSCSFTPQTNATNATQNEYNTAQLPGLNRVDLLFNDSSNELVSFPLESEEEILENYLLSFAGQYKKNLLEWQKLNSGEQGGVGLWFFDQIDLSQRPIGMQLYSQVNNTLPYYIYLYFQGDITV